MTRNNHLTINLTSNELNNEEDEMETIPIIRRLPELEYRKMSDLLVISTLLHFITLVFTVEFAGVETYLQIEYLMYSIIISCSTSFSVLYHLNHEEQGTIAFLNYLFAAAWYVIEFEILFHQIQSNNSKVAANYLMIVIALDIIIVSYNFVSYKITSATQTRHLYKMLHTIFHIINAGKSVLVAYLIGIATEKIKI